MKLRQHLITRMPFGDHGISLGESALEKRRANLTQDLVSVLPCLKELNGSQLIVAHEFPVGTWKLAFYLAELPQLALRLSAGRPQTDGLQDHFLNDVQKVLAQQQTISVRLGRATGATYGGLEEPSLKTLRRYVRRHQFEGELLLASGPDPGIFPLDDIPRVLPTSIAARIECRVDAIRRSSSDVRVLSARSADDGELMALPSGTAITLARLGLHRSLESGQRLLFALETKAALILKVNLVLAWADGAPDHLELVDFC